MSDGKRILVIGGQGAMGSMFRRLFEASGSVCKIHDAADEPTYPEVEWAEVVCISVPLSEVIRIVDVVAPRMQSHQLLCDLSSIKYKPVAHMLNASCSVIGVHPVFGPMPDPRGQNAVMCPARPGSFGVWLERTLEQWGVSVVQMDAEDHDALMAVVQNLMHVTHLAFGLSLAELSVDLSHVLKVCSPVYRIGFAMMCRMLSGNPELYADIQLSNPKGKQAAEAFAAAAEDLRVLIEKGDRAGLVARIKKASNTIGDYKIQARAESDELVAHVARSQRARDSDDPG